MNPDYYSEENLKSGRKSLLAFVTLIIGFELFVKLSLLLSGTLRASQIGGTITTIILVFFLCRGTPAAWWLSLLFTILGTGYAILIVLPESLLTGIVTTAISILLLVLLVKPTTRAYLESEKDAKGVKRRF